MEIPEVEDSGSSEWSGWTWNSVLVESSNCREIMDNLVDMAHFFYVHFAFPVYFKNVFEGHVASQFLHSRGREDKGMSTPGHTDAVLRSEARTSAPRT